MENYNFNNLTPDDFEIFCKDILNIIIKKDFRTYASGGDKGVDIECLTSENGIIAQTKRWSKSKFNLTKLQQEAEKVKKLSPKRYILFITISLTKPQTDKILDKFQPYLKLDDIYDEIRLNDILNQEKFECILKKWEKLWLPTNKTLKRILKKYEDAKYKYNKEKIIENSKIYIKTSQYNDAIKILNEENIIIIHGNPGVGKTSLAENLVKEYLKEDFELIYGEVTEIKDIEKNIYTIDKTVILIDDFLGDTDLQLQENVTDNILKNIIEYCKRNDNKKLILTTRTYIYVSALNILEKFKLSIQNNNSKLLIDVTKISNYEKARILYNHLFYNGVINSDIYSQILKEKFYFKIIEHKNYTPRIISLICEKIKATKIDNVQNEIIEQLNNINLIWEVEYNKLTEYEKVLILIVYINNNNYFNDSKYEYMQNIFDNIFIKKSILINDFSKSLKKLTESFITVEIYYNIKYLKISNPSIKDFIKNKIDLDEININEYIEKIFYVEELYSIYSLNLEKYSNEIKSTILNRYECLLSYKNRKDFILYNIVNDYKFETDSDIEILIKRIVDRIFESYLLKGEYSNNDIELLLEVLSEFSNFMYEYTSELFIKEEIELEKLDMFNKISDKDTMSKYIKVLSGLAKKFDIKEEIVSMLNNNIDIIKSKFLEISNYEIDEMYDQFIDYSSIKISDSDVYYEIRQGTKAIVNDLFEEEFIVLKDISDSIYFNVLEESEEKSNDCIDIETFEDKLQSQMKKDMKLDTDFSSYNYNKENERQMIENIFERKLN